jgi:hypothetical protein
LIYEYEKIFANSPVDDSHSVRRGRAGDHANPIAFVPVKTQVNEILQNMFSSCYSKKKVAVMKTVTAYLSRCSQHELLTLPYLLPAHYRRRLLSDAWLLERTLSMGCSIQLILG